ncbi:MAG: hypothetical protein JOZ41_09855, partial [Chloroflexi bacterium]|nr:hypothetical protein [Chloroflexota bacterium]
MRIPSIETLVQIVGLKDVERQLVEEIERRREEVVALATDLIRSDTRVRHGSEPSRDEAALQQLLANRLRAVGAETELWEPRAAELVGNRLVPPGLRFDGRPQLLARFPGTGDGRSILLNDHIDVVSSEPHDWWSSDPNRPEVREGRPY